MEWYILQALSGQEKRVATAIREKADKEKLSESVSDIVVPVENIVSVRRGKKVNLEKRFLPGYILIRMDLSDDMVHLLKSIPKIGRFLGIDGKPQRVSEKEVENIMVQIQRNETEREKALIFQAGDSIKINDGPFESFIGSVEEVDVDKKRIKVAVMIFGRSTPLDLHFNQVSKVKE